MKLRGSSGFQQLLGMRFWRAERRIGELEEKRIKIVVA
jgi:hypothetical protein